jgi:choline kinase
MKVSVVYMVAGLSSRFGGKIKQFAKVGPSGETLIEYSMKQAISAGAKQIVFIVGDKTEVPFKEMFGNEYEEIPIKYAKQHFDSNERDKPWGTVDAIVSARDVIDGPFVVCNGDDIYGTNSFKLLFDHLKESDHAVTVGYELETVLPQKGKTNRGIFQHENDYVKEIKEVFEIEKELLHEKELTGKHLCSMNLFGLHVETLEHLSNHLDEFKKKNKEDRRVECLLPEKLGELIKSEKIHMKLFVTNEQWFGVTNPDDEEIVKKQLEKIHKG